MLIAIGTGFFLQETAGVEFGPVLGTYWPLITVLIGVVQFLTGASTILGAIILLGVGVLLHLEEGREAWELLSRSLPVEPCSTSVGRGGWDGPPLSGRPRAQHPRCRRAACPQLNNRLIY